MTGGRPASKVAHRRRAAVASLVDAPVRVAGKEDEAVSGLGLREESVADLSLLRDPSSQVVWPVLGVVLLCLLMVALLTVIRRLRRDAAERRQQKEEARRRHPARSTPLVIDVPTAAAAEASNGHRPVASPTAGGPDAAGSPNGSRASLPDRTRARIEAGLYDVTGRRTADPFEAVRAELIAYGGDGAELARTALSLPGARPGRPLAPPPDPGEEGTAPGDGVPAGEEGTAPGAAGARRRRRSRQRPARPEVSSRAGGPESG